MQPETKYARLDTAAKDLYVFQKPGAQTDVTFRIGKTNLHFWKLFLTVASPVFERMFTSEFKEKDSSVIPLPGKELKDMDIFLQNMHPAYAWKPLEDDGTLEILLRLADEYQTEHIRQKCLHYMDQQIRQLEGSHSFLGKQKTLHYFFLCEQFQLKEQRPKLLQLVSCIPVQKFEGDDLYTRLSEKSKADIVKARCLALEKKYIQDERVYESEYY